ncbi:MAG: class I SAM-dependent methyltransferase [Parapedobacter sp.]|nr:MAG: class I SAM-dependent methyltransferase [Parapedobacter sp.]
MKGFWDERYSGKEFVYGEIPNEYLKGKLTGLHQGKILFPAEGEGRNAVFAAKLGWTVSAFDQSETGKEKAQLLAQKNGVTIDYIVSEAKNISYAENSFDALALIYAHFHPEKRKVYHQKLSSYLKKGGILILEAFGKKHTENQRNNPNAGGPKDVAMLYSVKEIKDDFDGFEIIEANEKEKELSEGKHHLGKANVAQMFAIKK